ncbi:hypothetical protein HPB47_009542 [Ixodes persulcatus]|uniref:Uncharacterized protein n=1 Tax=Ixodes persulcatus TaxID=34615 RepID=A0AC60P1W4_IXOPE|nr:hypothetical protein HPB47_009542 [Ixodes persulcatus]
MAGGHRKFRSAHPFGKKKRRPRPREVLSDPPAAEANDTASNATAPTDDAIAHVIPTAKVTRVDTPLLSDAQKAEIESRARDTEKKLSQMSATRRKQSLLGEKTEDSETTATGTSFTVLSLSALNELLRRVKCKLCGSSVNISKGDREYGIAVKLILNCDVCGEVDTTWSSPRVDGDAKCNPFEVNVLATRAVLSTGNGQTVLNDFCAALNISKRGMHTKTYQNYVKNKLNPAARRAAAHVIGECVDAVKALYSDLDFGNPGNIAVSFDGPSLGGKGKLTGELITKLTMYYGWALKGHQGDIDGMQNAVLATYNHVTSTDAQPNHSLCPKGQDSWCKQNKAAAKKQPAPKHRYNLPQYVAEALLPVYMRLSDRKLLERCQRGKTQNSNESLHSVIWSLVSKSRHASLYTVEAAVAEAVMRFNVGKECATEAILRELNVNVGSSSLQRCSEKDRRRLAASDKKHKQAENFRHAMKRKRASGNEKDYVPGAKERLVLVGAKVERRLLGDWGAEDGALLGGSTKAHHARLTPLAVSSVVLQPKLLQIHPQRQLVIATGKA